MTSRSDADVFGFRRGDIYDFLENHGLKLNRNGRAPSANDINLTHPQENLTQQNAALQGANEIGEHRSFSAIVAARRAEFISYREAMKKLRQYTGERLRDIAAGLKSHGLHEQHMAHLSGSEQAVRRVTGSDDLTALLDETIENGGVIAAWVGPDDQADPDLVGWIRREFVAALRNASLPCPDTLLDGRSLASSTQSEPVQPDWGEQQEAARLDWLLPYKGRSEISLGDAAAILADCGPVPLPKNMGWTAEGKAQIAAWRDALIDAIGRDFDERIDFQPEIKASGWTNNRDAEQMLSHADIRMWCSKRGHRWPIPELNPQPATNAEASAEIERLKEEISTARQALSDQKEKHERFALWLHGLAQQILGERNIALQALDKLNFERDGDLATLRRELTAAINAGPDDMAALNERAVQMQSDLAGALQEIKRLKEIVPPQSVWLMEMAVAVQRRYWGDNWEPDDRDSWPKQADILEWLKQTHPNLSEVQRKAIEIVACPVDRKK